MGNKNVKQTTPVKGSKPLPIDANLIYYERDANLQFSRMKWKGDNTTVPLLGVNVNATILDVCSEISITHTYKNTRAEPLEALFEFTLSSEDAAVCGLSVEVGDKKVIGKVKEKSKAFDTYDDAIASGHNAFLVESKGNGIYTLSVGSLAPNQEAKVTIDIISELRNFDSDPSQLLFLLPNTMFPLHDYPLNINVIVNMNSGIKEIKCNVPNTNIDKKSSSLAEISIKSPKFNQFHLIIQLENPFVPCAHVEISDNSMAFMLNFFPTWDNIDKDLIIPASELVFVVDRSGSMAGSRINAAKSTLQLFLRSLPEGVIFNIVGFGSEQKWLFNESKPYTESNLQEASKHVDSMSADLGGTELLAPLKKIFSQAYDQEFPRQLFVLTDGEVDNTIQVIDVTRRESRSTRVFTLGIGEGASVDLVKGLAKAAKGEFEFIKSTTEESMEAKVIAQLERALEPCLRQVTVNWGGLDVKQGPFQIRPVFNGERLVVYGIVENIVKNEETIEIKLEGTAPDGNTMSYTLPLNLKDAKKGNTIHKLAAKQIIQDLQDNKSYVTSKDEIRKETIRLGVKYQIATNETSFVAVAEREEAVEGNMVQAVVPSTTESIATNSYAYALPTSAPMRGGGPPPIAKNTNARRSSNSSLSPAPKPSASYDKIARVQREVDDVKNVMQQNISLVLERGEKLDMLEQKTSDLSAQSAMFKSKGKQLKKVEPQKRKQEDRQELSSVLTTAMSSRRSDISESEVNCDDWDDWDDELEGRLQSLKDSSPPPPAPEPAMALPPPSPYSAPPPPTQSSYSVEEEYSRAPPMALPGMSAKKKETKIIAEEPNIVVEVKIPTRTGPLKMSDVIKAQRANGSWDIRHIEWMTTVTLDKIKSGLAAKSSDVDLLETCWATCLVMAMLEEQYSGQKNEWNLVEQKARKFVKRSLVAMKVNDDLFEDARKFVKSMKLKVQ